MTTQIELRLVTSLMCIFFVLVNMDFIGFMTFGCHIPFKCKEIGPKYLILMIYCKPVSTD